MSPVKKGNDMITGSCAVAPRGWTRTTEKQEHVRYYPEGEWRLCHTCLYRTENDGLCACEPGGPTKVLEIP